MRYDTIRLPSTPFSSILDRLPSDGLRNIWFACLKLGFEDQIKFVCPLSHVRFLQSLNHSLLDISGKDSLLELYVQDLVDESGDCRGGDLADKLPLCN